MATQEARLRALATAIANKIKGLPKTGIPAGGAADQVLAKSSAADGATYWSFPGQFPFYSEARLAGGQTINPGSFQRVLLNQALRDDGARLQENGAVYNCPYTGLYLFTGHIRIVEATPSGTQVGIGIGPSEADTEENTWQSVGSAYRATVVYSRMQFRTAGDTVKLFTFSDQGYNVSSASMQAALIRRLA